MFWQGLIRGYFGVLSASSSTLLNWLDLLLCWWKLAFCWVMGWMLENGWIEIEYMLEFMPTPESLPDGFQTVGQFYSIVDTYVPLTEFGILFLGLVPFRIALIVVRLLFKLIPGMG